MQSSPSIPDHQDYCTGFTTYYFCITGLKGATERKRTRTGSSASSFCRTGEQQGNERWKAQIYLQLGSNEPVLPLTLSKENTFRE